VSPVPSHLIRGIVRILAPDGSTVGTGFLVHRDGLIATCAHVVQACGIRPGDTVRVAFHATGEEREATVERDWWRDPDMEDVAILRLQGLVPEGVKPLPLGISLHSRGHDFFSWGYRLADVFAGGLAAGGKIQARILYRDQPALQLLSNQIDRGMSGAPLWDVQGRRVVGMINAFWKTTRHQDAWLALAIPTETLRTVCPLLQLSDLCPYRGLEPFTEDDAEFFFGRERVVEHLLERLRQEPRFLAVLGPSGSGKSSLVQAGLIPRLRRGAVPRSDRWAFIVIRPGKNPLAELEAAGLSGASQGLVEAVWNWQHLHPEAERLTLVMDQFEELLVDCPEETRREFVAQLAALLDSSLPVTVILVIRDDFYSRFVREARPLVKWLERSLANIPPTLEPKELRAIVEEPARAVGLALEEGLAEVIVQEAMETTPQGAPGTILPLLEFALTGLWERREEGLLTHAAYRAIGGVTGGLTQWADSVLARLDEAQRRLARRVLTDLVHLGDESRNIPDSRRRRTLDELCRHEEEREAVHQVVRLLADARLLVTGRDLTTGQETVELIHEALLREWRRLLGWLQEDRRFLAWRQTLEERIREWEDKGKDEGLLLRGAALTEAQEWLALRAGDLEERTQEFIRLSAARAREEQEHRERMRRQVILGLAAGLLAALLLAFIAWSQRDEALRQREAARAAQATAVHEANVRATAQAEAEAQRQLAEKQRNLAQTRQMVATGQFLFDRIGRGPLISTLLGLEALQRGGPWPEAEQLVRRGLGLLPVEIARMKHEKHDDHWIVDRVAVAFSPDGKYVISGGCDKKENWGVRCIGGTARVWEAQTGREIARMSHEGSVTTVAFSPDGKYLISGGCDKKDENYRCIGGTARVWEAQTGREIARMSHEGGVTTVAFSPDGKYVISGGGDGTARVWEAQTGREIARMSHEGGVTTVAFSPDGKYVISGGEDGTARVWEAQTGREIARMIHEDNVTAVAFSPDGKYVISRSGDGTARVWKAQTGHEVARMSHEGYVVAVAFSPDGKYVISGSGDGTARVWEAQTGHEVARISHKDGVAAVALSPDGKYVASGSLDGTARVWEARTGREIARVNHEVYVSAVAFSPDGKYVISGGCDKKDENYRCIGGTARVWEAQTGREVARMSHNNAVVAVAFSPDGKYVVSGSFDGTVRVWETQTGHEVARKSYMSNKVAFSPDGKYIISGGGAAHVWEAQTGREIARMSHEGGVVAVAFSPDGRYVVSGGGDGTVRVWEAQTGREIARMSHEGNVVAAAFSPDGRYVVSGSLDGTARVWEVQTGREIARMSHNNAVVAVAFSPDGKYVVSGSWDRTARLWWWRPEDLIAEACRRLPRNLTLKEWRLYVGPEVPYHATCPNLPVPEQ